ncbi:hypothetical protein [Seleniivibrio woodruffii]|uniref:hypothetical protein n=1 Tax=Seleniivibrio woodruffii TaxID=1078050 RepID=UPI0026F364EF|nr:hypothetical protein [Seleniivibrio woodruffii]
MIDEVLKRRIAKIYSFTTRVSIVLASAVIMLSLVVKYIFKTDIPLDRYTALFTVFLLIATPFTGVFIAFLFYLSEKNRAMTFYSIAIILVLIVSIILKIH